MSSNDGRNIIKITTTPRTPKIIPNNNIGNILTPDKAVTGPSLIRKVVSPAHFNTLNKSPKSIEKHRAEETYNKLTTVHIKGGSEWLVKSGFSYNSSVQPIFSISKGVIHSIVLYPTAIVDGSLLLYKNVKPEEPPVPENIIAAIRIDVIAEELPVPVLIPAEQLSETKLILNPNDRLSIYSSTDITGIDIEINILYA